jgi:hypothetical protein
MPSDRPRPSKERLRDSPRGAFAATPVGPASDQCHVFTLKDNKIDPAAANPQSATIQANPVAGCVFLSSGTIETGEATFVVCCVKDTQGQCANCTATVTLQVIDTGGAGGAVQVVAKRVVRVVCVKT